MNIAVVLLSWQRIGAIRGILNRLSKQTRRDFTVHISNGNLEQAGKIDEYAKLFAHRLDITVHHDGNDIYAFRRFPLGKMLAENGVDVILFIDDDVLIPSTYIKDALSQYEEESYCSGFAWSFQDGGSDYYKKRTRHYDNKQKIHYCGTGMSMVDARIFLEKGLLNAPKEAYKIEDLWLSYYAQHVMGWQLKYINLPNTRLGGGDSVALYKTVARESFDKADLLRMLVKDYGWKL